MVGSLFLLKENTMALLLEELIVYRLAMEIGDDIWTIVSTWPYFAKDTLAKQIVRSADSIALNIAEGYGRYHFKENKNFCFFARGSIIETKSALTKAKNRKLIDDITSKMLFDKLQHVHKLLNAYINKIGNPVS